MLCRNIPVFKAYPFFPKLHKDVYISSVTSYKMNNNNINIFIKIVSNVPKLKT